MSDEDVFTEALNCADKRRMNMEEKRVDLDSDTLDEERLERKRSREERKEEREAAVEVELKKMRLMMEIFTRCIPKGCGYPKGA